MFDQLLKEYIEWLENESYSVESINKCTVNAELYATLNLMKRLQSNKKSKVK